MIHLNDQQKPLSYLLVRHCLEKLNGQGKSPKQRQNQKLLKLFASQCVLPCPSHRRLEHLKVQRQTLLFRAGLFRRLKLNQNGFRLLQRPPHRLPVNIAGAGRIKEHGFELPLPLFPPGLLQFAPLLFSAGS